MKETYNILYLCSNLLDFDGTRGDVLYLMSRLKERGIQAQVTEHLLGEKIDVTDFDFVYGGVCPQKYEDLYLKHLREDITGLKEYIEAEKPMLAVEQSFLFLMKELQMESAPTEPLLGVLPIVVKRNKHYTIGNVLMEVKEGEFTSKINGFINTRYYFALCEKAKAFKPFGDILLGIDYLWERKYEGIVYKNFVGTQLRGPLLPRNYDLCDWFIEKITGEKLVPIPSELEEKAKAKLTADCERFIETGEQKKEYVYIN